MIYRFSLATKLGSPEVEDKDRTWKEVADEQGEDEPRII